MAPRAFPYNWAYGNNPLTNGANWGMVIAVYCISLVLGAATAFALRQRDVGV